MGKNIQFNDLPSKKFDDLIKFINYDVIKGYKKNTTTKELIDSWIDEFKIKIEEYLRKKPLKELINNDKSCKDFNYIIEDIKQKIHTLFSSPAIQYTLTKKIKDWREDYFSRNTVIVCNEKSEYGLPDFKPLYDFCEDNIYIEERLNVMEKSDQCKIIIADMTKRKDELKQKREILERQRDFTEETGIPCSTTILEKTFTSLKCNFSSNSALESNAFASNVNHGGGDPLGGAPRTQSPSAFGDLPNKGHRSLEISDERETHNSSSSNDIGIASLPVLGILVLSFILYRFTPLGTKLHTYLGNKVNTPINQNNDSNEQILSNTSNYEDMYSESMQYNLSYQTV
ncbi:PIR Superfamily Protein [Plasmodium ovale wallikeri]|uniref:PIR Superfamily Protein n=1 Tax=Plasmodium ovale wallikeri TaxID=864142 RepID=A0A1A9APP0_PLAOA|nr:PIR Superfamily Protein [Plasmodium ovale wallikeri]